MASVGTRSDIGTVEALKGAEEPDDEPGVGRTTTALWPFATRPYSAWAMPAIVASWWSEASCPAARAVLGFQLRQLNRRCR